MHVINPPVVLVTINRTVTELNYLQAVVINQKHEDSFPPRDGHFNVRSDSGTSGR